MYKPIPVFKSNNLEILINRAILENKFDSIYENNINKKYIDQILSGETNIDDYILSELTIDFSKVIYDGTAHIGKFFAIDGVDFTGKSSILELIKDTINKELFDTFVFTKEPGSPYIKTNQKIREILLDKDCIMDNDSRISLYKLDRDLHWSYIIRPYINSGFNVFTDRTYLSTMFYQNSFEFESASFVYMNKINTLFILYSEDIDLLKERSKSRELDGQENLVLDRLFEINEKYKTFKNYNYNIIKFDVSKYINNNKEIADRIIDYIKESL